MQRAPAFPAPFAFVEGGKCREASGALLPRERGRIPSRCLTVGIRSATRDEGVKLTWMGPIAFPLLWPSRQWRQAGEPVHIRLRSESA